MDAAGTLSFADAVTVFPIAVALHVLEEWPRFPRWARRFASRRYSDREYLMTHALAVAAALAAAAAVRVWATQPIVMFFFLGFVFGPGVFCNAWFHVGATVLTRTYCPGAFTSMTVYVPLSLLLMVLGLRQRLFTPSTLILALAVATVVHVIEVGHNVFKRW